MTSTVRECSKPVEASNDIFILTGVNELQYEVMVRRFSNYGFHKILFNRRNFKLDSIQVSWLIRESWNDSHLALD